MTDGSSVDRDAVVIARIRPSPSLYDRHDTFHVLSRARPQLGYLQSSDKLRPCFVDSKNQKVFKIFYHIESYSTYMKH